MATAKLDNASRRSNQANAPNESGAIMFIRSAILGLSLTLLTAAMLLVNKALAIESPISAATNPEPNPQKLNLLNQVILVDALSDVSIIDWAFQTLQSLEKRYGCIAGDHDRTYQGEQVLTRDEFAVSLNTCLAGINKLVAAGTSARLQPQDLASLQRLQAEFASELANLQGRVDVLEVQSTQLEAPQFSTTTQLSRV